MGKDYEEILAAYEEINQGNNSEGEFKKTLFHVHTPASYDFKLHSTENVQSYKNLTADEIYTKYIKDEFPVEISDSLIPRLEDEIPEDFKDLKEFYSYLLIANRLVINNYEMVVVTDHHSVQGIKKLQKACDALHPKKHINIIQGVELSCTDKLHVVVIFAEGELDKIQQWIDEYLMSNELGMRLSAKYVLEKFIGEGNISYIAHVNTSNLLDNKSYSGAYKSILLGNNSDYFLTKYLGVNANQDIKSYKKKLNNQFKASRNFVIDCDAHAFDLIPEESMYIKVANNSTNSLLEALRHFNFSVKYNKPKLPEIYIKGLYLSQIRDGYLSMKDNLKKYTINFSQSMNSFIGGRGTGKSTTIDIINFVLNQDFKDEKQLFYFSQHGPMYLQVNYKDKEYIVNSYLMDINILGRIGRF